MDINAVSDYNAININAAAQQQAAPAATTAPKAEDSKMATTSAVATEAANTNKAQDSFVKSTANADSSNQTYNRNQAAKGLSKDQVRALTEQQTAAYTSMIKNMLGTQAAKAKNAAGTTYGDVLSKINGLKTGSIKDQIAGMTFSDEDVAAAQKSIGEDGEWGVNAVATRIMDMAVSLSGGDSSKLELLKNAVLKGFEGAAKKWGADSVDDMPSITGQTYKEVQKRFDYWESNGSMTGYEYGKTNVAEDE